MPGSEKQNVPARGRRGGGGGHVSEMLWAGETGVEPATVLSARTRFICWPPPLWIRLTEPKNKAAGGKLFSVSR